ncbi:MAG: peptidoglycan editing factor PgeF [Legionella sp.]|nr:peptidoglycan editing factor PgeF [Legionella sp.]
MKNNIANWNAPKHIHALSTTRFSGFSQVPYDSNNLALHVGDDNASVLQNRQQLVQSLQLPCDPLWLEQTHSTRCIIAEQAGNDRDADAAIAHSWQHPLVILTADCLPITLCAVVGDEIAAIHAGWRGLIDGIVENTLSKMHNHREHIIAWIGPSICENCYEVGEEVLDSFVGKYSKAQAAFKPHNNKWLANLPKIAEFILKSNGIQAVYQSELCTFEEKNGLFSYRRQKQTGRIATLIWINKTLQDSLHEK